MLMSESKVIIEVTPNAATKNNNSKCDIQMKNQSHFFEIHNTLKLNFILKSYQNQLKL